MFFIAVSSCLKTQILKQHHFVIVALRMTSLRRKQTPSAVEITHRAVNHRCPLQNKPEKEVFS